MRLRIRNLSATGLGGNLVPGMFQGEVLILTWRGIAEIGGRVVWIAGSRFGLSFRALVQPIDFPLPHREAACKSVNGGSFRAAGGGGLQAPGTETRLAGASIALRRACAGGGRRSSPTARRWRDPSGTRPASGEETRTTVGKGFSVSHDRRSAAPSGLEIHAFRRTSCPVAGRLVAAPKPCHERDGPVLVMAADGRHQSQRARLKRI